jgi:hypothetical protein
MKSFTMASWLIIMEEQMGRACGTLERGEKYLQNYSRYKCMEGKEHEGNSTIVWRKIKKHRKSVICEGMD